jgi:hypothetical protein
LLRARFESFEQTGTDPDWYHPDVRWHLREDLPESETLVGRWLRGAIKDSSQEIEMSETWVIRIVDGVNVETWEYKTKAEALKAVCLEQ